MVVIENLVSSDLKLFLHALKTYTGDLGTDRSNTRQITYVSIAERLITSVNALNSLKKETIVKLEIYKHEAIVFACVIAYYLGYPFRKDGEDDYLRDIAIDLLHQVKFNVPVKL